MAKVDVGVDLFYSAGWHNITGTDDVYTRDPIQTTRGRGNEFSRVVASNLTTTIENRDALYSPRNPSSALYGLIGRNTPIRAWVRLARDTFTRTEASGWGTSETQPYGTALIWASFASGGSTTASSVNGTQGIHSVTSTGAYCAQWTSAALIYTDVTVAVTVSLADSNITGGTIEPAGILLRQTTITDYYMCRVSIGTDESVTATIYSVVAGVETSLGSTVVAGLTHTASQSLRVIAQVEGENIRMKVYNAAAAEPGTWAVSVQSSVWKGPGGVGIRSGVGAGNTNTKPIIFTYDNLDVLSMRAHAEVQSWSPRWNTKGNDGWVPVDAYGVMRRYGEGGAEQVIQSALYRALVVAADVLPVAYWPLEEGKDASKPLAWNGTGTSFVNYAPAYQPGAAGPTDANSLYGITPLPIAGVNSVLFATGVALVVPDHSATGTEIVTLHVRWKPFENPKTMDGAVTANVSHRVEFKNSSGTNIIFGFQLRLLSSPFSSDNVLVAMYNPSYVTVGTNLISSVQIDDGAWHEIQVRFHQNGGSVDVELFVDGVSRDTSTVATSTLGFIKRIALGVDGSYTDALFAGTLEEAPFEVSSVSVHTDNSVGQFYIPMTGHVGETAGRRIERLSGEEGLEFIAVGDLDDSELCGEQRLLTVLDLMHQAAEADIGILYEPRGVLGIGYRTHKSLYNQTATLALTYGAAGELAPPLFPVDDLSFVVNDVTAERVNGGVAISVEETGPLSVLAPPIGVGRYPRRPKFNVQSDDQLQSLADWTRHIGTWDELRYTAVPLDLTAMDLESKAALIAAAAALDIGDRLTIASPPGWVPPDTISQIAQSFTETIDSHLWKITANAVTPETPWQVGVLDSTTNGKLDCRASTLNVGVTTAETTAYVAVNDSCLWSTTGEPYDWRLDAERVTVTNMATNAAAFVAAGTGIADNNGGSLTPGLPAGIQKGDLLLIFASIRNSGTGTVSGATGYTTLLSFGNIALLGKIHTGTESAPTVTFSGAVAGADSIAQMAAFRHTQLQVVTSATQLNGSAANIATPLLRHARRNNCVVLNMGWRQQDWASVATLAGYTEIGEPDSGGGDNAGNVWDYLIQTTATDVAADSFVVTGGVNGISRAMVVMLAGDVQTATLTRSVNTVAQAHAAGDEVHMFNPFRLSK